MSEVRINMAAYRNFLNRSVQPYLMKKAEEIAQEARNNVPVGATSELKNSVHVDRLPNGGASVKVSAPHASAVHDGTGPGHVPDPRPAYFPRVRKRGLVIWSENKNLNPYKVAHGISKRGTPANPFLADAIEKVLGRSRFRWISRDLNI